MKTLKILSVFFILNAAAFAQVQSVQFFMEYNSPLNKRIAVNDIEGVGGGVRLQIGLISDLSLTVNASYILYSLNQDNAIQQFDWRFWNRYNDYINQTLADPVYSAALNPIQKMDFFPVYLTLNYNLNAGAGFYFKPYVGGGVGFYTRRLYMDELWRKYFNQLNYTFSYEFRNFAPELNGNPFFALAGVDISYRVSDLFSLTGKAGFTQIIETDGSNGFDKFPFSNSLNFVFGIDFNY